MASASAALGARMEAASSDKQLLDLSGLSLKSTPPIPVGLREIKGLDLSSNRLAELAADVFLLSSLQRLDLGNNRFAALPPEIGSLQNLAALDVSENRLAGLPRELGNCSGLRGLELYSNRLGPSLRCDFRLENVARLDLSRNGLEDLADLDQWFPAVEILDLSNNALDRVPDAVTRLKRLRVLDLSGNGISEASSLRGVDTIEELRLDSNKLAAAPKDLLSLPALRVFSAAGNPFGELPGEFATVTGADQRQTAEAAMARHIGHAEEPETRNFLPAEFFTNFSLAITGIAGVLRFIDHWYKRPTEKSFDLTMKLPDGTSFDFKNLSRKSAMRIVEQRADMLVKGKVSIDVDATGSREGMNAMLGALAQALTVVRNAEIVPNDGGAPTIVNNIYYTERGNIMNDERTTIRSIQGSNVNINSKLDHVQQTVGQPSADPDTKAQLQKLIEQLKAELQKAPPDKKEDAEAVSVVASDLVEKAMRDKPNKKLVSISADGLMEAAKGIAGVVPIAIEIVKTITAFIGGI